MEKKNSRTKNSVLNLATSFGSQMLVIVLRFITRTVFIYTLGKAYLGINGLFSDILTLLSLTELGIDTALNFQLYKPLAEGDDHRVRVLMKFYKQAYRVVGTVILVIGLCLIPLLPFLIKDYDSLEAIGIDAVLIFILYLLQSVTSYLFWAYRAAVVKANQKKYLLDVAEFAITIITNVTQIFILIYLEDFVLYTAAVIFFNILRNFINAQIAKRFYPQFFIKEEDSLSKEEIKGLFKDCGALFVYKANTVVLKATDNLVLSKFVGLEVVGLYSNYLLFYVTIKNFLYQMYNAVQASMGNLFATSNMEKKYKFFQIMNFLSIVIYGTAAVGIAVCANELISCWISDSYVIKQPFAILIGVEILFQGLQNNLGQVRNVSGVFRQMWYRPLIGIVINLVVSIVLVQFYGIYGVILGTIAAYVLTNFAVDPAVLHKYAFNNIKPVSEYYKKNITYIALLITICAIDIWLSKQIYPGHGWISLFIHAVIVVVTVPASFVVVYWKSQECQYVVNMAIKLLHKKRRQ